MILVRFGIIAVFVIMLLPTGPQHSGDERANSRHFCERYPKTCDASGEILSAFRKKIAYGVVLARQSLEANTGMEPRYGQPAVRPKLDGRYDQWQAPPPYRSQPLPPTQHSTEWRPRPN